MGTEQMVHSYARRGRHPAKQRFPAVAMCIVLTSQLNACARDVDHLLPAQTQSLGAQIPVFTLFQPELETEHFKVIARDGYLPLEVDDLEAALDEVFRYVSARLGVSLEEKIVLSFTPPVSGPCPARGIAMSLPFARIEIVVDRHTSARQLAAVLAHEVGHILHYRGFEEDLWGNEIFNEGLATWAADQYWHEWQGTSSFGRTVRSYLDTGTYLPLDQRYVPRQWNLRPETGSTDCLEVREIFYTEWASFIEYLVEQHGRAKLLDLMRTASVALREESDGRTRSLDYLAVYGMSLDRLESAWLAQIKASQ